MMGPPLMTTHIDWMYGQTEGAIWQREEQEVVSEGKTSGNKAGI